jgi:hypothetical protein
VAVVVEDPADVPLQEVVEVVILEVGQAPDPLARVVEIPRTALRASHRRRPRRSAAGAAAAAGLARAKASFGTAGRKKRDREEGQTAFQGHGTIH